MAPSGLRRLSESESTTFDAGVIGAGPNGLVANLLVDAGSSVIRGRGGAGARRLGPQQ